jgi:hypothetical protein
VPARKASALSARSAVAAAPSATVAVPAASRRGALQVVAANPRGNSGGSRKGLAKFVERVNAPQMKDDLIPFRVGMTVKVGVTVVEGGKSRVQPYEGIVIAIHRAGRGDDHHREEVLPGLRRGAHLPHPLAPVLVRGDPRRR